MLERKLGRGERLFEFDGIAPHLEIIVGDVPENAPDDRLADKQAKQQRTKRTADILKEFSHVIAGITVKSARPVINASRGTAPP
jgi:hypothetical protein